MDKDTQLDPTLEEPAGLQGYFDQAVGIAKQQCEREFCASAEAGEIKYWVERLAAVIGDLRAIDLGIVPESIVTFVAMTAAMTALHDFMAEHFSEEAIRSACDIP